MNDKPTKEQFDAEMREAMPLNIPIIVDTAKGKKMLCRTIDAKGEEIITVELVH